jgi:hypothetical protein
VAPFQHLLSCLAGPGAEDGVSAFAVHQEDAGVVEVEAFPDEVDHLGQEFVGVKDGTGGAGDFGGGLELPGVFPGVLEQAGILDGDGYLVGEGQGYLRLLLAESPRRGTVHAQ